MVSDRQFNLLMKHRRLGCTLEVASAKAGMTPKTGRKWIKLGILPSKLDKERDWRTRPDPFEDDWEAVVLPLLERDTAGSLQCTTILEELKLNKPETYNESHLRTLQRRVRDWRATHGPNKEVFFPQEHEVGREAQVDFTHATELGVTISGQLFEHLFFVLVLCYSGFRYVELAFGETFEALASGIQNGFWTMGGVTQKVCTDSLSAATHELKKTGGRAFNKRYKELTDHLGVTPRRINVRRSNENGVVERSHGSLKSALDQALIIRGSRDFATADDYLKFVDSVVGKLNLKVADRFAEEKVRLQALPSSRLPDFTVVRTKVFKWSTIRVANHTYSVPSRLIGHGVLVKLYPNHLEVLFNGRVVAEMPRLRGVRHRIDYRHVIHSLVRKPGAFARYRYREDLFPTLRFRQAYDALHQWRGERADIDYVRILHLAATEMESRVEEALELALATGERFDYADIQGLVAPRATSSVVDLVPRKTPKLKAFDSLMTVLGGARAC
ncbi:MAG: IS21 family transposase [Candidatus Eremiobacteraeota bacterium]|nr:IS21 family transposase [Candidatus Eremiobacteraeota bacterium]